MKLPKVINTIPDVQTLYPSITTSGAITPTAARDWICNRQGNMRYFYHPEMSETEYHITVDCRAHDGNVHATFRDIHDRNNEARIFVRNNRIQGPAARREGVEGSLRELLRLFHNDFTLATACAHRCR